jgi:hypothetical protein
MAEDQHNFWINFRGSGQLDNNAIRAERMVGCRLACFGRSQVG